VFVCKFLFEYPFSVSSYTSDFQIKLPQYLLHLEHRQLDIPPHKAQMNSYLQHEQFRSNRQPVATIKTFFAVTQGSASKLGFSEV
jgi:hypothetical protein